MKLILAIAQIVISVLLVLSILLQKGGQLLGRETPIYRTLRGAEKKIFWASVVFGFIFVVLGILNLLF